MKKVFVIVAALLVCFVVTAQENKVVKKTSSSLYLNIGPSFPMSDFASNNAGEPNAGYAKTGFNLNLNYDYMFEKYVGITFNGLYGTHKMDQKIIKDWNDGVDIPGAEVSHYQYVGLLAGPVFTGTLSPDANINFKLLGGVARSRSPQATYQGVVYFKQDWTTSFAWRLNTDFRYTIANNIFLMVDLSYTQMRPDFTIIINPNETNPETLLREVHVNTLNLNAGVGIKF